MGTRDPNKPHEGRKQLTPRRRDRRREGVLVPSGASQLTPIVCLLTRLLASERSEPTNSPSAPASNYQLAPALGMVDA
jgi:hypothetical protein